jgi:hypothetical protein
MWGYLDVKWDHLMCQNSQLDARKICIRVAVVHCVLWASRQRTDSDCPCS